MKNLYDRLRPEALKAITEFAKHYPSTAEAVKIDLKQHYVVSEMSLQTALFLGKEINRQPEINFSNIAQIFEMPEL